MYALPHQCPRCYAEMEPGDRPHVCATNSGPHDVEIDVDYARLHRIIQTGPQDYTVTK